MASEEFGSVSIIVPTYNRKALLRESLASLLGQTVAPLEIIVVDDGSTDGTAAEVAAMGGPIRCVTQVNAGKSTAVNRGLALAQGDFIWFFDDDDWAEPKAIELRLKKLREDARLDFVGAAHFIGHADEQGRRVVDSRRKMPQHADGQRAIRLFEDCYFSLCSVLARRSCYEKIGGFDATLKSSEDYDILWRLASQFHFAVLDEPVFTVRMHGGVRGSGDSMYQAEKRREVFRQTDRVVGLKLRAAVPLVRYQNLEIKSADASDSELLLERAVVMASKGLIAEMFEDFGKAAEHHLELSPYHRQRVRDSMLCDYAFDAVWDARRYFMMQWRSLHESNDVGRGIAREIRHGVWRLARMRHIGPRERSRKLSVLLALFGVFSFR